MSKSLRALIVEGSKSDADLTVCALRRAGFTVTHRVVADRDGIRDALAAPWDVVLCNWDLPGLSALDVLAMVREAKLEAPFIIVPSSGDEAIGGIAHELNNALSVILSYTDLAIDAVAPGDPLHADLCEVRKAGERAAALMRELLALSRSERTGRDAALRKLRQVLDSPDR